MTWHGIGAVIAVVLAVLFLIYLTGTWGAF